MRAWELGGQAYAFQAYAIQPPSPVPGHIFEKEHIDSQLAWGDMRVPSAVATVVQKVVFVPVFQPDLGTSCRSY